MTVRQLLATIDSHELSEWEAWFGLQPFGDDVESWRSGTIAAVIANCNSKRGKFKAQDFMPKTHKRRGRMGWEEIKRNAMAWVSVMTSGRSGKQ